jgi:hypothetical protein
MKHKLIAPLLLTSLLLPIISNAQNTPAPAATAKPATAPAANPTPAAAANPTPTPAPAAAPAANPTPATNTPAAAAKPNDNKAADVKAQDAKADVKKEEPKKEEPKQDQADAAKKAADSKKPKDNKKDKAGKDGDAVADAPPKKPSMKTPCPIGAFRVIGMETIDAEARREKALKWLAKNGPDCAPEKLVALRNNRAQWMGAADSTEVAGAIDTLIESITDGNPDGINLLYGTAPPPPKPADDKKGPPKKK